MSKKDIIAMNERNIKALIICLNKSKSRIGFEYYRGRLESLEHLQTILKEKNV